jgi:SNF2 family DNA or RNA helicase
MSKKLKLKTKPWPHQLKATKRAVKQGNHAFFFEPRLGKTKAALDSIAVQHRRGLVKKAVVIAPLIALDVWVDQITEHLSVPCSAVIVDEEPSVYIWPDTKSSKKDPIKLHFYLINYDKFSRRGFDTPYTNDYTEAVEEWNPDLFVLDESHRCKKAGAVRSQALWRSVRRLRLHRDDGRPFVYLLSGTPNPKGYIDLFSQYRILDEGVLGTAKSDFEDDYCVYGRGSRKYTIMRYKNKKRLLKKVDRHATVVNAKEAGLEGVRLFNPIRFDLPPSTRELYERFAEELIATIGDEVLDAPNAGVRRLRLLQITGGFTTSGREIHGARINAARDYLQDLREQEEAVVVYARHLPEVRACYELVQRLGYRAGVITGGVKRRDRTDAIRAFQKGSGTRALVFQSEAGALAIELTRAAEVFYYSLPDSWETFKQTGDRVMGPKQTRPVRYTYLLARRTVDISVLSALRTKKDMHAEMMKHPRGFLFGF